MINTKTSTWPINLVEHYLARLKRVYYKWEATIEIAKQDDSKQAEMQGHKQIVAHFNLNMTDCRGIIRTPSKSKPHIQV